MKKCTIWIAALIVAAASFTTANADLFWDRNGTDSGAVPLSGDPSGDWDAVTANWNDSAAIGTPQLWDDASVAVFAAGTDASGSYTVNVIGTQTSAGITFEDSSIAIITIAGGQINLTGATP